MANGRATNANDLQPGDTTPPAIQGATPITSAQINVDSVSIDASQINAREISTVSLHIFNPWSDIIAFHKKYGVDYDGLPRVLPEDLAEFRTKFMYEELKEYETDDANARDALTISPAHRDKQLVPALENMLDALVDLVYVTMGAAYLHGFDFPEAWRRVHAANMTKVRAKEGESARGGTNDVIKPPGFVPPSHRDLVMRHAHERD